jgi:hypothetical protein
MPEALCGSCSTHLGDDDPRKAETCTTIRNGGYQAIFFVFSGIRRLADGLTSNVAMLLVSALLCLGVTQATVMLVLIASFPTVNDTCMQLGRSLCSAISNAASFTCTMRKRTIQAGVYHKYVRRASVVTLAAATAVIMATLIRYNNSFAKPSLHSVPYSPVLTAEHKLALATVASRQFGCSLWCCCSLKPLPCTIDTTAFVNLRNSSLCAW